MKIFTIFDSKAKAYLQPFFSRNSGTAIREITSVINNNEHPFSTNSEDYGLFELGEYDELTGKINANPPVHVINLIELKVYDTRQAILPGLEDENTEKENDA